MKKMIALLLALALTLSLAACGGEKKSGSASTSSDLSWAEIERLADEELAKEQKQK